jgi:hypothetical protein
MKPSRMSAGPFPLHRGGLQYEGVALRVRLTQPNPVRGSTRPADGQNARLISVHPQGALRALLPASSQNTALAAFVPWLCRHGRTATAAMNRRRSCRNIYLQRDWRSVPWAGSDESHLIDNARLRAGAEATLWPAKALFERACMLFSLG